jgi:hypothetical protein
MKLSDEVAAHVLGEVHTLTSKIDEQISQVTQSAEVIKGAANLIKENSVLAVKSAKKAVELAQSESIAHFEANMSKAVAKTLNHVASAVATKSAVQWIMGGVILAGALAVVGPFVVLCGICIGK